MPDSPETLDLLLLTVSTKQGAARWNSPARAALLLHHPGPIGGEPVTIRYYPRDLAEIRVFHHDRFPCHAVAPVAGWSGGRPLLWQGFAADLIVVAVEVGEITVVREILVCSRDDVQRVWERRRADLEDIVGVGSVLDDVDARAKELQRRPAAILAAETDR